MIDRQWPPLDAEWSQQDLHDYVRFIGVNVDPSEVVPQGVKYIKWPQPPLTESELAWAKEICRKLKSGEIKPLGIKIRRVRDPRRN